MVTTDAEGCTDITGESPNPRAEEEPLPLDLLKVLCILNL